MNRVARPSIKSVKDFLKAKMRDGQSVQDHCLTMIKDLEELKKLGIILDKDFQIDVILQSLSDAYG